MKLLLTPIPSSLWGRKNLQGLPVPPRYNLFTVKHIYCENAYRKFRLIIITMSFPYFLNCIIKLIIQMYTCIRSYIYKNRYCSSLALCCNSFYFVFIILLIDLFRSILSSLNFDTYMEEKSILHSKLSILCCS